jgi:hypothetical protein
MTIRQSNSIHFPSNPTVNQEYLADNSVSYVWTGDRWSAKQALETRKSEYTLDGLYSDSLYNPIVDITLDGGTA